MLTPSLVALTNRLDPNETPYDIWASDNSEKMERPVGDRSFSCLRCCPGQHNYVDKTWKLAGVNRSIIG